MKEFQGNNSDDDGMIDGGGSSSDSDIEEIAPPDPLASLYMNMKRIRKRKARAIDLAKSSPALSNSYSVSNNNGESQSDSIDRADSYDDNNSLTISSLSNKQKSTQEVEIIDLVDDSPRKDNSNCNSNSISDSVDRAPSSVNNFNDSVVELLADSSIATTQTTVKPKMTSQQLAQLAKRAKFIPKMEVAKSYRESRKDNSNGDNDNNIDNNGINSVVNSHNDNNIVVKVADSDMNGGDNNDVNVSN